MIDWEPRPAISLRYISRLVYSCAMGRSLSVPSVEYDGLVDTMFNMTRPNAIRPPALLIKLIEVVTAVANYDRAPRLRTLLRHADLVRADAELGFSSKGT